MSSGSIPPSSEINPQPATSTASRLSDRLLRLKQAVENPSVQLTDLPPAIQEQMLDPLHGDSYQACRDRGFDKWNKWSKGGGGC